MPDASGSNSSTAEDIGKRVTTLLICLGRVRCLHHRLQPVQIGDLPGHHRDAEWCRRRCRAGTAAQDTGGAQAIYEFEPDEEEILAKLLPQALAIQVYRALLESPPPASMPRG